MADEDLEIKDDAGFVLRSQLAASEFFLRHWKAIAAGVAVVVLAIAGYGWWRSATVQAQRDTARAINDVEQQLDVGLLEIGQARAFGTGQDVSADRLVASGDELIAIAERSKGAGAVEASLKAAELYRLAGNAEKRRKALEIAARSAEGVLAYAAEAGLANLEVEQGKVDDAIVRFRRLQQSSDPFLARKATLDLAATLEAVSRQAEAAEVYEQYLSRWPEARDVEDVKARLEKVKGTGTSG